MTRISRALTADKTLRTITVALGIFLGCTLAGCKKKDPCRGTPRAEGWTGHAEVLPPGAILCAGGMSSDPKAGSDSANVYFPGSKAEVYLKITKHLEAIGWREVLRNDLYSAYESADQHKLSVQIFKDTDYSRVQFKYTLPKTKP